MGPNPIQGASSTAYVSDGGTPVPVASQPLTPNVGDAADVERLLQALAERRDGAMTRGVPEPNDEAPVDGPAFDGALVEAESNVSADIYAFMALFTQLAQEMRKTAREQRQGELEQQVSAITTAADKMIEAAEKRFAAAVVQGAMQIGGGLVSIGSGIGSAVAVARATPDQLVTGSAFLTKLNAAQSITSGLSQVMSGAGTMGSGSLELDASEIDAEAKRQEALGTSAQARREAAQEVAQNMADLIKDAREQLRAMQQSNIETNRGIARNI